MDAEISRLLSQGIAAARAGDSARARELLLQVIAQDEEVEAAWLWLSSVVDDPEERLICLENVLALNPGNRAAQDGLHWLQKQGYGSVPDPGEPQPPEVPRPVLDPLPPEAKRATEQPSRPQGPGARPVEIDPYGCPYCGGSVSGGDFRCDHCGLLVTRRTRKRTGGSSWLGWVVLTFAILAAVVWLEGFFVAQVIELEQLPLWLNQTVVRFVVGSALFSPEGIPGELVEFAGTLTLINTALAVLCVLAAVGLALRIRIAYFASFIVAGIVVTATGLGLLTGLTGWLPALFRLGLVALSIRWLVDCAPAFEWDTRYYNADTDPDLQTDMDYYNRGQRYYEMGMWAKAAAHWKVATQLAPTQVQYHIVLANAYAKMGYRAAALAAADRALALTPDDQKLRAFRDTLPEPDTSGILDR